MIFGYARVSTQSQNLDRQLDALHGYGVPADRLFVEKISGTTKDRPELLKLQQFLRDGDLLVIESLSRLGRSTKDLLTIISRSRASRSSASKNRSTRAPRPVSSSRQSSWLCANSSATSSSNAPRKASPPPVPVGEKGGVLHYRKRRSNKPSLYMRVRRCRSRKSVTRRKCRSLVCIMWCGDVHK